MVTLIKFILYLDFFLQLNLSGINVDLMTQTYVCQGGPKTRSQDTERNKMCVVSPKYFINSASSRTKAFIDLSARYFCLEFS